MQVTNTILVTGATGRHGGTGARAARRLREQGHAVRVLVRTLDERSAALTDAGCDVRLGDLRDRASLLAAMDGVDQATFCFPVDAGIVEAAASFGSALHAAAPSARLVVMSMIVAQPNSPSHLGRAQWLAEEVLARYGQSQRVLRIAAMFFENLLVLHGASIRDEGVIRNCFGQAASPWIAGDDAGDLLVAALLHPERFAATSYPPGAEVLSHAQIADALAVRYEPISMEAWRAELLALSGPVVNPDMARHIAALGQALAQRGAGIAPTDAGELARLIGHAPTTFAEFAARHRAALTPVIR